MISLSIGLTDFTKKIRLSSTRKKNKFLIKFQFSFQRKLSIGTNSDPETTLDTSAIGDSDKAEKKKKKKRKKDLEAEATEEQPAAASDEQGDDDASKKEKKKKKKKDKNKDKSDE